MNGAGCLWALLWIIKLKIGLWSQENWFSRRGRSTVETHRWPGTCPRFQVSRILDRPFHNNQYPWHTVFQGLLTKLPGPALLCILGKFLGHDGNAVSLPEFSVLVSFANVGYFVILLCGSLHTVIESCHFHWQSTSAGEKKSTVVFSSSFPISLTTAISRELLLLKAPRHSLLLAAVWERLWSRGIKEVRNAKAVEKMYINPN